MINHKPTAQRSVGAFYTNAENIHKVIDPLFLDDLKKELSEIEVIKDNHDRVCRLIEYQQKLSELTFLDPACGSGNFLVEIYRCLRELEIRVLSILLSDKIMLMPKVSINQLYGIEIDPSAAETARQTLQEMQANANYNVTTLFFPNVKYEKIITANALRMDWNSLISKHRLNYIVGNPPYLGTKQRNNTQREDMEIIFSKNWNKAGMLDYVACWFKVASDMMKGTSIKTAFVTTSSITQGNLVRILWEPLFRQGMQIFFAYKNFKWSSDSKNAAQVHCAVIGFEDKEHSNKTEKKIYNNGDVILCKNINGYLLNGNNFFLEDCSTPISKDAPKMIIGRIPLSGGRQEQYLVLDKEQRNAILEKEPSASQWIRQFSNGREFVDGKERYCLWLEGISSAQLREFPLLNERVEKCREWRMNQKEGSDAWKLRNTPHLFRPSKDFSPDTPYLAFPQTSAGSRDYIPIAFITNGMIPGPKLCVIQNATLYDFGVLTSSLHMAWARVFSGYLGAGISYSISAVYNTFPWPTPTEDQKKTIAETAQMILNARALYPTLCLADLYDRGLMPAKLADAHKQNDLAVLKAYGLSANINKNKYLEFLISRYRDLSNKKEV